MQTFETYLQSKGLSPSTIDRYQRYINSFMAWYGSEDVINCEKKDILAYLNHLKNRNLQSVTRNHNLTALRHYFDYLMSENQITGNPTALIKLRGIKKHKLPYTYNPEELTELVDKYYLLEVKSKKEKLITGAGQFLHQRTYLAKMRNYTMLQFFVYQGITTKEALKIKLEDLELHKANVTITKGTQRGNARTLPLNAVQIGVLMQYLNEIRPQLEPQNTDDTLFLPLPKNDPKANKNAEASFKGFTKQLKCIDRNFDNLVQLRSSVIKINMSACQFIVDTL